MGLRTRHFLALMKKNWIIWKRTLGASLCELFCPVALMAIMAIARALIDQNEYQPQSNMLKSVLMAPMVNVPNITANRSSVNNSSLLASLNNSDFGNLTALGLNSSSIVNQTKSTASMGQDYLQAILGQYAMMYGGLSNFSQTDLSKANPLSLFFPQHCQARNNEPSTPIIAVAGPQNYTMSLIKDLNNLINIQKQSTLALANAAKSNKTLAAMLKLIGISTSANVDLQIKVFNSHKDIMNYLSSPDYMQDDDHLGMCFGFSITETNPDDMDIKLVFSGQFQDPNTQSIPSQLDDAWSEFEINADFSSYNRYTKQGYALMQNWIANAVLRAKSGVNSSSIAFTLVPFMTDSYIQDDFQQIMSGMLPFFMLLIYILPMYRLISNVVSEKESKARESMKMMGLNDFSYWMSWWAYYSIIVTIISVLVLIVLSFNVLKYSNRGLVFLFFWIYGLSLFGLAVFLQAFFSKARVAAISGTLVYFGTSFVNVAVQDPQVKAGQKSLASLLTTVAVSRGANNLAQFETSGVGVQAGNMMTQYQFYSLGNCLVVMTISLFLFFFVGIYLDNVLPSAYGLRKGWCFCLSPSYWCRKGRNGGGIKRRRSPRVDEEQKKGGSKANMLSDKFEQVPKEFDEKHGSNVLMIEDLQKKFENGFHAVQGISVKMYPGQIFALLGHNGAGKTTTISMLTGLIESTSGNAEVFGRNLFEDMQSVREFLGVCPQHDILFDLLTPEEHLDIFCDFKGVSSADKKVQIKQMLIDVDVAHHKDTVAVNLSGGSRRKLSVAIALIGNSKFVLLDEPTSGMDLSARRKLWNMLKNYKNNKIIILTTHYMDEADILGDRIGIMTGGKIVCLGSSLFLKNRYGVGYNLTMVKKTKEPVRDFMEKYLQRKLGPQVYFGSEISSEITFKIPNELSGQFKQFFTQFDQELDTIGIQSYGISVTTLEEVFLQVGHGEVDSAENHKAKEELKSKTPAEDLDQLSRGGIEDDFSISDPRYHVSGLSGFFQHLQALFLKRFFIYRRNRKGLVVEVLIPVLLVLIGFAFSKVQFFNEQKERNLAPNLYPIKQRILVNQNPIVDSGENQVAPAQIFANLPDFQNSWDLTYKNYNARFPNASLDFIQQGNLSMAFDRDVFDNRLVNSYSPYRFGSYFIYEANNLTNQFKAAVFMNLTSQEVAAAYPEFLYEAILQQALKRPNLKFRVTTAPYPVTEKLRQRAASASGFFIAFVVSIGFALIPAMVISFILNEREKNLKHMQMISGMSLPAYWISNLIFDIFKGILPSIIVIGLMYAFDLGYDTTWLLFLLFPVAVIPFTYVFSFMFASENVAQTFTIFLHFVFGGIGAIVVFILRLIESTRDVGDALRWVFKLVPTYCLTDTIMYDASKARLFLIRPELKKDSDWDVSLVGGNVLVLCLHFIFWCLILAVIESGALNFTTNILAGLSKNRIPPKDDETLALDEDVVAEDIRVKNAEGLKVKVHRFRKVYPGLFRDPVMAVERTSFGLEYGECFALLGINGAGKSTTFKALTCEIPPTNGTVTIGGFDVQSQFSRARKLIGYCPQHDAIFDLVTVEEHLEYYARIKGIPARLRKQLIERQIEDMNLSEHRTKAAGTLSGGNKRKLSVAMAIIGNPPIILLDEPSAGMDPEARRFMWRVVHKISHLRKQSSVILTTHSMEEAEALSTKMGIMVKGGVFKCFGSSQHIKNKFGTGYEIEAKVKKISKDVIKTLAIEYGLDPSRVDSGELVSLRQMCEMMKEKKVDPFLIGEVRKDGLGNDLVKEATERQGMVSQSNFIQWLYVELAGMSIVNGLCLDFATVEILEHYNDYYKLRVPRGDKSIGFVFGLIEDKKESYTISEYSVSQTTLEQIFQTFANMKIDDENRRKLTFKKLIGSNRAELYSDREAMELKRQFSKNKKSQDP